MATYLAVGVVRETGAVLTERILYCKGPALAVRIAKEWARENALRLEAVEQTRPVWTRRPRPVRA